MDPWNQPNINLHLYLSSFRRWENHNHCNHTQNNNNNNNTSLLFPFSVFHFGQFCKVWFVKFQSSNPLCFTFKIWGLVHFGLAKTGQAMEAVKTLEATASCIRYPFYKSQHRPWIWAGSTSAPPQHDQPFFFNANLGPFVSNEAGCLGLAFHLGGKEGVLKHPRKLTVVGFQKKGCCKDGQSKNAKPYKFGLQASQMPAA